MNSKPGRHTPAFLLLFLAEEPSYGAMLLARMKKELPFCFSDSAIVYRSLQEMEKNGWVDTKWEMGKAGPPQKWYSLTLAGKAALTEYAEDVRQRQDNFAYFAAKYEAVVNSTIS